MTHDYVTHVPLRYNETRRYYNALLRMQKQAKRSFSYTVMIRNRFFLNDSCNPVLLNRVVPKQWKVACLAPVPKVAKPAQCSDYRPISVTPILSRLTERYIVRSFIYPALLQPPPSLYFSDQYAFRPSGSTTAALVALLHTVCDMLATNNFVHVI